MADTLRDQLVHFDWKKSEPVHALLCLPGVALPLLVGIHYGYPGTAALMAGGAQCVGFGSYQQPLFRKSGAMVAAAVGIAISAMVGALCRDSTAALLCAAAVWAFLYGLSNSLSTASAWVGQQCCVFLIISSAAPSTPGTTHDLVYSALLRGVGVLAGAAFQAVLMLSFRYRLPQAQTMYSKPDFDPTHFQRSFLREQMDWRGGAMQFSFRLVVTALVSVSLYRTQTWASAYWIGMTAMLVPKPEFTQTVARGVMRASGTLLGALVCTLIVIAARPRGEVLAALALVFLFFTYLLVNVNYGSFSVALTGYICFILAVAHNPPREVLAHRVAATVIGASLAFGIHLLFLTGRRLLGIATPRLRSLEERLN